MSVCVSVCVSACVSVCVSSVSASVTEDEAQEALLGAVSQRCCYGKAAVNEMDIYQIISSCALHVSQCCICSLTASVISSDSSDVMNLCVYLQGGTKSKPPVSVLTPSKLTDFQHSFGGRLNGKL